MRQSSDTTVLATSLKIPDVLFAGPTNPNYVADLYRQADVFVLPSYYFMEMKYEAWGLVINEAISMGLPIITTTAVGAAFDLVIDGHNGFVVRDNDIIELNKAMEKIISLDLSEMGMNSRAIFEKNRGG